MCRSRASRKAAAIPRAIVIEQVEELNAEPGGRFAALEGGLKEGLALRDQDGQAAGGGRAQRLAFLFQQGGAVRGVFNELMAVIAAAVGSDLAHAVEQAHSGGRGDQRQGAA